MPSVQQASSRKSDKQFRDQLMIVGKERDAKGTRKLRLVAESMYNEAMDGNVTAQVAIRDTLDGKPAQALHVSGDPDNPLLVAVEDSEITRRLASMLWRADQLAGPIVDITPAST